MITLITLSLLILWIVFLITWFSGRQTSEALRVEIERLTSEVDELRNQLRTHKTAVSETLG